MAKIFISYRREDSQYQADKLHGALKPYVANPKTDIFIDIDNIPLGVDFAEYLDEKVGQCEVLLALIGHGWSAARNPKTGARRLDEPGDFVRTEIAAALKRGIPVVPVLLDGAPVPDAAELPDDLKPLARRNGLPVTRVSFDSDVERLVRGLPVRLRDREALPPLPRRVRIDRSLVGISVAALFSILLIGLAAMMLFRTGDTSAQSLADGNSAYERGDFSEALLRWTDACDGGEPAGCTNLGQLYDIGQGVTQDYAEAHRLYKQGCEAGILLGCTYLGTLYSNGRGVAQDYAEAHRVFKLGCDGGEPTGCTNLGLLYDNGQGVAQDDTEARRLYLKGCEGGEPNGCNNLGVLYQYGQGVTQDNAEARRFYKLGCDDGSAKACENLKLLP